LAAAHEPEKPEDEFEDDHAGLRIGFRHDHRKTTTLVAGLRSTGMVAPLVKTKKRIQTREAGKFFNSCDYDPT
jgi:hypothetical protein